MTGRMRKFAGVVIVAALIGGLVSCSQEKGEEVSQPKVTQQGDQQLSLLIGQLRSTVDGLVDGVPGRDLEYRSSIDTTPCDSEQSVWPFQGSYTRKFFVDEDDSRPTAEVMLSSLEAQGWTLHRGGPGNGGGGSSVVAVKDGASITINSGLAHPDDSGAGIALLGATACVAADGTIDHTNPS